MTVVPILLWSASAQAQAPEVLECDTTHWVEAEDQEFAFGNVLVPGLREDCDVDPKALLAAMEATDPSFVSFRDDVWSSVRDECFDGLAQAPDWTAAAECDASCSGSGPLQTSTDDELYGMDGASGMACELAFRLPAGADTCWGELVCRGLCVRTFSTLWTCD
ncbi:MAG: hypothetical protein KTR31_17510 [Myxococcales bacterium]|nr:hypothetical protein [Myxococcales bacterium]